MGNKIRIKQIDLQGIFSASNQVDIISASNYAQFVTQLDTTMSSDSELTAVSSSISQSIYTINQVIGSGLISGSSQLTSSYDTRYILSGSITQTTWDNIDGKPAGLVSESTDLTSLNQFTQSIDSRVDNLENLTGSYATTGSNVFKGNQTISGSVSILIPGGTATGLNENSTPNNIFWSNEPSVRDVQVGWTAEIQGGGTYTVTDVQLDVPFAPFVAVTLSDVSLALGYRVRINFSKNSKLWQFNNDGTLTGLPDGIISGSSQIANLGFVTGSFITEAETGSFATTGSNTFIGNQIISGSVNAISGLQTNTIIPNEPSGTLSLYGVNKKITIYPGSNISGNNRIENFVEVYGNLEAKGNIASGLGRIIANSLTGSLDWINLINVPNGIISGSSQLTSSYDLRYALSGSGTSIPAGTISGSSQLTSSFDERYTLSGSVVNSNINTGSFATTGSNTFSGSQVFSGSMTVTSGQIIASTITNNSSSLYLQSGSNLYVQNNGIVEITGSIILNGTTYTSLTGSGTIPSGTVSGSSQLTSSYDSRYVLSGSVSAVPAGTISGSSQLTASFDTRYLNTDGDGVISGSSQLTSSFDTRYTLSGSGGGTTPAGTVSGSSQLTSSYDGRYTLTSSFNSFTASAQTVTTGSNSFNGTQIITGSLIITTGSFVGSQILANTSSLYLTSGSNMYVQNNGVVEITGSLKVSGSTRFETVGGDEGGEIEFGVPQTNTTLSTSVKADIYQNRFRIFDGNTNGVFIDLSKAPLGVAGELTWKSSGIVNAGTFVQLDNIKATIPSSGNRALALVTTTGTISGYISAHYQGISGGSAGISQSISLSTSTNTSIFGWNFGQQGDTSHYILRDDTNNRVYRFVVIIGGSYNNNFISIERLH